MNNRNIPLELLMENIITGKGVFWDNHMEARAMNYDIPAEEPCLSCGHSYSFHVNVHMEDSFCDKEVSELQGDMPVFCGCDRFVGPELGEMN